MYSRVVTSVLTSGGIISEFLITIGLHQRSTLCKYLFAPVMDKLSKSIHKQVPLCMLFAYEIALMGETRGGINTKSELWQDNLEFKGF